MTIERAAAMAAEWWTARLQAGDPKKFFAALYPLILADLESEGESHTEVDHDPRDHVLVAVRAAGLDCNGRGCSALGILPMKHALEVYPDRIQPKAGYGRWLDWIPVPP